MLYSWEPERDRSKLTKKISLPCGAVVLVGRAARSGFCRGEAHLERSRNPSAANCFPKTGAMSLPPRCSHLIEWETRGAENPKQKRATV